VRFTLIVNKREVPGGKDHEDRAYDEDENPADVRDKREDSSYNNIDDRGNNENNEGKDIRQPSHSPDGCEDVRKPDPFTDTSRPGKPDCTEGSKKDDDDKEDELHEKEEKQKE